MNVVLTMPDRLTQYEKELKASLAESSGNPYVLSGYATQVAYDSREPTWGPDDDFAAVSSAEQAARAWLASQGAEAQVELIHLEGDEGRVVAVVSQSGIEQIDYGPSTGSS